MHAARAKFAFALDLCFCWCHCAAGIDTEAAPEAQVVGDFSVCINGASRLLNVTNSLHQAQFDRAREVELHAAGATGQAIHRRSARGNINLGFPFREISSRFQQKYSRSSSCLL